MNDEEIEMLDKEIKKLQLDNQILRLRLRIVEAEKELQALLKGLNTKDEYDIKEKDYWY